MRRSLLAFSILLLASLACNGRQSIPPPPENSVFDSGKIAYGFFPSPPEATLDSILQLYKEMSRHGDFVLIQQNTAWEEFVNGTDGESQTRTDIINQVKLARQNNLDYIFVIDALNGLNRREFIGLPIGWEASFANPDVRSAYRNYALWVVRTFHPHYLGLASEINTYMDAHPGDAGNFISLYNEIYALVKAEAPETQIFVSFQWDDLNNMFPQPEEGDRQRLRPNWEQIEAFEPNLDLCAVGRQGRERPAARRRRVPLPARRVRPRGPHALRHDAHGRDLDGRAAGLDPGRSALSEGAPIMRLEWGRKGRLPAGPGPAGLRGAFLRVALPAFAARTLLLVPGALCADEVQSADPVQAVAEAGMRFESACMLAGAARVTALQEADEALQAALGGKLDDETRAAAALLAGSIAFERGDAAVAQKEFERAAKGLSKGPFGDDAELARIQALEAQGRDADAMREYANWEKHHPQSPLLPECRV